jgi:hypothetical protein
VIFPVRYELGFISQKTTLFIVAAVKTSNLAYEKYTWRKIYLPCEFRVSERIQPQNTNSHSEDGPENRCVPSPLCIFSTVANFLPASSATAYL